MRQRFRVFLFLLVLGLVWGPSAAEYVPDRIATYTEKITVQPNGNAIWAFHGETKILAASAVEPSRDQTVQSIPGKSEIQSIAAYVVKKDGKRIDVAPEGIKLLPRPQNDTDWDAGETRKSIDYGSIHVGDTVVFDVVYDAKSTFSGYFTFNRRSQQYFDIGEDIEIFVPTGMTLSVEAYDYDVRQQTTAQGATWFIHHEGGHAPVTSGQYVSLHDRGPRVYGSTFKNYDEEAAAMAELVRAKAVVTPEIQAKADAITAGVTDRRTQARLLFEWVRDNITYDARRLEAGGPIPRLSATETLHLGRGDCKGKVTLLTTLLKAKGIESYMTAVDATNGYSLPKPATLAPFSHVVAWLPEFNLFLDSTSRLNDFESTPYTLYGKPVMRIGYKGPAISHVPLMDASDSWITSQTTMTIDDRGRVSGTATVKGHGVAGTGPQALAVSDFAKDPGGLAGRILKGNKMASATGTFDFPPAAKPMNEYGYTGSFQDRDSITDRSFAMPRGLTFARMEGVNVAGPVADKKFRDADPVPCYAVHAVETYSLQLPAGKRPASLSADQAIKTANLDYVEHWSLDGQVLQVRHDMTTKFDSPLCSGQTRTDLLDALDKIATSFKTEITLVGAK
jgi:hypothetical protein